jgi:uncharacterized membrane protein YfhO
VVLADAWAPGWRAEVDGARVECLRVGGYFRGVAVPAGAREVVFTYRPAGWTWGLRLAGLGLLITMLWWGRSTPRWRAHRLAMAGDTPRSFDAS